MRLDHELLHALKPDDQPLLHAYDWLHPSATHGYFLKPESSLHVDALVDDGLEWARRPTGGGFVFHLWDLAFSFLLPSKHPAFSLNPIDNYRFVNEIVFHALRDFFSLDALQFHQTSPSSSHPHFDFCMAMPTQYDIMYQGKKIAGAAQRKRHNGFLHQGTLSLVAPDRTLLMRWLRSPEIAQEMYATTFAPLGEACSSSLLQKVRRELQTELKRSFEQHLV